MKVKAVRKLEYKEDVYNLEVEGTHNFFINNGVVVHNCIDALRYSLGHLVKKHAMQTLDRGAFGL